TEGGRSDPAARSAPESAAIGEVSTLIAVTRAAAPPLAGHAGRVRAGYCPSAADRDHDRRFALGRPVDLGADPIAGRAGSAGAAAAPVHGAPGVSRPLAHAGPPYSDHAQSAERAQ